jgi:FAD/FMN-containing dehydrogenase
MTIAARTVPAQLSDIVGSEHVLADPKQLVSYEVDGMRPSAAARPGTVEEMVELVRLSRAEKLAVIPCAARTKLRMGMPPARYDLAIDLTRMNRVLAYDPDDLTLGVEAGIPLLELQRVLGERNQFLPLAVPFFSRATMGGTVAANVDTPLRQFYGTARDYVLGMEFVSGEGVKMKSGARVVKCVTGYDLHKLMIGGLGTLGIITRINFKTFPRPRVSRIFLASFADASGALKLRNKIAQSALTVSALDIFSPQIWQILADKTTSKIGSSPLFDSLISSSHWIVAASFSGNERVLGRYAADLARMAEESSAANSFAPGEAERTWLWDRLCESIPIVLDSSPAATILRISVLPTQLGDLFAKLQQIARQNQLPLALLARAVGVVYCALLPESAGEEALHRLAKACGAIFETIQKFDGHAMIPWCPTALKQKVNIWGPPRNDFVLMKKVKEVFDPQGVLSPGRFVGGL